MEIKIAGIDYSLSCPCVAIYCGDADKFSFESCRFFYLIDSKKYSNSFLRGQINGCMAYEHISDEQRYDHISAWAHKILIENEIETVWIEGYAMGVSNGRVFNIAENGGVLKHKIYKSGIKINLVPPTTVKKFATGKGNSDKDKMHDQFKLDTGLDLQELICPDKAKVGSPVGDIVDAFYILKYGVMS